ncbi:MAG TPA: CoA-binding protein [Arcobacter sp.]|jgi:predicted CoA-binding protein|nr:CoA-binding protein [Arcobacter sp.]
MECEFPRINSNNEEIKKILEEAKSIAIIGCSPNSEKDSNKVAKYLLDHGYIVYPVYPKEDEILGQKVYRSLKDIPYKVDIVDIFRKPEVISSVVDVAIERGDVDCVWSQLGLVNNVAMEKAKEAGMKTVQNYCTKIEHKELIG